MRRLLESCASPPRLAPVRERRGSVAVGERYRSVQRAVLDECDVGTGGPYSFLRASIGSILDALIAGRYVAMTTTAAIVAITRTKVRPSVAETPNSRLR